MHSATQKVKDMASTAKEKLKQCTSKAEEKAETATAHTRLGKEIAHERGKAREAEAKDRRCDLSAFRDRRFCISNDWNSQSFVLDNRHCESHVSNNGHSSCRREVSLISESTESCMTGVLPT
ncbi:uncharacterized protein A4U43_C10F3460 [Asparagus officinalis]|uniref:Uncharacterized protein n=1 Tax=Asparagus officinalis TaxID=4686 RepID=A0A5P1E3L8_ASPOF|nr:uncharacterized protein A4U43_C10F3460 [Asparagus officinalis]